MSPDLFSGTAGPPSEGPHLATIGHQGRFWDVYLEFIHDARDPSSYRAQLCFSPSDRNDAEKPLRTTTIIVEPSFEDALERARKLEDHQLVALLRSCLPD